MLRKKTITREWGEDPQVSKIKSGWWSIEASSKQVVQ